MFGPNWSHHLVIHAPAARRYATLRPCLQHLLKLPFAGIAELLQKALQLALLGISIDVFSSSAN